MKYVFMLLTLSLGSPLCVFFLQTDGVSYWLNQKVYLLSV
jgi:hypothetical protein